METFKIKFKGMLWKGNKYGSSAPRKGTKLREGKGRETKPRGNGSNEEGIITIQIIQSRFECERFRACLSLCLRLILWQKSVGKGRGRKASGQSNGAPTALEMGDAGRADAPCADDDACAPGRDSGSKAAQGWKKEGSRGKRVPTYNPHAIEGDFDDDEFESAGMLPALVLLTKRMLKTMKEEEKEEDDDEISADEEISAQLKEDLELVEYELEELEDEQTHDDGDSDDDSDFDDEDFADLDAEQKRQSASTMRRKKELQRKQAELMKRQKEINARSSKRRGKREKTQGGGAGRTSGSSGKSGEEGSIAPKKDRRRQRKSPLVWK